MDYAKIITIDPARRSGKPCIRDMRITVCDALDHLASGMSGAAVIADFRASIAFAADRGRRLLGAA